MSWPLQFHLGDSGVEVRLGSWTLRRVLYSDIETVKPAMALWNEHWTNPWPWRFVTIRRRTGWIRNFVINPGDRDGFQRDLSARLGAAR